MGSRNALWNRVLVGIVFLAVIAATAAARPALAEDLSVRFLLRGALDTLDAAFPAVPADVSVAKMSIAGPEVFLMYENEILYPAWGIAGYVAFSDPTPSAPWGSNVEALFLNLGGFYLYGASIDWNGGRLATVSAGDPLSRLSGTWTAVLGADSGVTGAGPLDLVVDMALDFNPGDPQILAEISLLLKGVVPLWNFPSPTLVQVPASGPGEPHFAVNVIRGLPVHFMTPTSVEGPAGTLSSYAICVYSPLTECLTLDAFSFGAIPILSVKHSGESTSSISCAISAGAALNHLSGDCSVTGGSFLLETVDGVTADDARWRGYLSLP